MVSFLPDRTQCQLTLKASNFMEVGTVLGGATRLENVEAAEQVAVDNLSGLGLMSALRKHKWVHLVAKQTAQLAPLRIDRPLDTQRKYFVREGSKQVNIEYLRILLRVETDPDFVKRLLDVGIAEIPHCGAPAAYTILTSDDVRKSKHSMHSKSYIDLSFRMFFNTINNLNSAL